MSGEGWQRPEGCICPSTGGDGTDRYNPPECPVHGFALIPAPAKLPDGLYRGQATGSIFLPPGQAMPDGWHLSDPGDAHMHDRPRPVVLATDGAL